jgi:hypothetical protein
MGPDDGGSTDIRHDLLIAGDSGHTESPARIRAAEDRLIGSSALLAEEATALSPALETLSKAGRLGSLTVARLTSLKMFAQAIVDEVESVLAGTGPSTPQGGAMTGADLREGVAQVRTDGRRRNSKTFDFLLLESLYLRPQAAHPIGLQDLDRIARAFDPAAKHGSLVAKLNRWKHADGLLRWIDHEDMTLTPEGAQRRMKLLPLARKEGQLDRVQSAIHSVLGVKATY